MQPLPHLPKPLLEGLRTSRNLLAFSGGVDSSALFFTLLYQGIPFSVAHVNYQTRPQSSTEEAHVAALCKKHDIEAYFLTCKLSQGNFEHRARKARYDFFETLASTHGFDTLLTAHQLDDRLEWLLMQLCQGAGAVELLGFKAEESRGDLRLVRPFLEHTKASLKTFLHQHSFPYYLDSSNDDPSFLRNRFRARFAAPMLEEYTSGIRHSFRFLSSDAALLEDTFTHRIDELFVAKNTPLALRLVDKATKHLGILMSQAQRREIDQKDGVVGGRVAVGWTQEGVFVAPFVQAAMPKPFKEACRKAGIPPLIRPYMYTKNIAPSVLVQTL
ncbi:MAG: tRNA lysidine(34) synthetase TilS [Campylobacterales bacterium]|nr:tRNA lysidine(34) synthetase TilS [Campylobacterales bacterium]